MRAFLSHSSADKALVEAVADELGDQAEIDSRNFEAGILNVDAIRNSLTRSAIYVLFLTSNALSSGYVRFEASFAQELLAKGVIDRFFVICDNDDVFRQADTAWKNYSFIRYLNSPKSIARFIQYQLILARSRKSANTHPTIDRARELKEITDNLTKPSNVPLKGIYFSGNEGIGRRTFAHRLYRARYPSVTQVFAEITVDFVDGYEELYRKVFYQLTPVWTASQIRTRFTGFAIANDTEKARQVASLLESLTDTREAIFIRDAGGLLNDDGSLQTPLFKILSLVAPKRHPTTIVVAERMMPARRRSLERFVYQKITSFDGDESRQLAGFLLADAGLTYTDADLDKIAELGDGHPFNIKYIVEAAKEYGLSVALSDVSELAKWKRKRGSDYVRKLAFSDTEKTILSCLKDFPYLNFDFIADLCGATAAECGVALTRLLDLHIIEEREDAFQISPPLKSAIERETKIRVSEEQRRDILKSISSRLTTIGENDYISPSMVEAGVVATIQSNSTVPPLFETFLLPSHYVWIAKRQYDARKWMDCLKFSLTATTSINRLSPIGKVEACRLLCLSAARLNKQDEFAKGMKLLKMWANDKWARSNISFLNGFNLRLEGNLPAAEIEFRNAYSESPGNFNAVRELAALCLARNDLDDAEAFARSALNVAADNPYVLDVIVNVLIKKWKPKNFRSEPELELLLGRLEAVGDEGGHSFYTTRLAQYEAKKGNSALAKSLIDTALRSTSGIFDVHATRAEIYQEAEIKSVVSEEIEWMRKVIYRESSGDRRTNRRRLHEIESNYLVMIRKYDDAKAIYDDKDLFSKEERLRAIRSIDFERSSVR